VVKVHCTLENVAGFPGVDDVCILKQNIYIFFFHIFVKSKDFLLEISRTVHTHKIIKLFSVEL